MKYIVWGLFFLDLSLKYLAVSGDYAVINQSVSFGVKIGSEWWIWAVYMLLFVWLYRQKIWLVLAGGVANVVSRIVWGGVVDYFSFYGLFSNNLADWMIAVGVVFYAIQYIHANTDNI